MSAVLFSLVLALAWVGAPVPGVSGQGTAPGIRLVAVPVTVASGDTLSLTVEITDAPAGDVEVSFRFGSRLETRSEFRESTDSKIRSDQVITVEPTPSAGVLTASIDPTVAGKGRPAEDRVVLPADGVYPLEIVLHEAGSSTRLARIVTYVIRIGEAARQLDFAWVWPFHTAPPEDPNAADTRFEDVAELDRLAEIADLAGKVPGTLTLAPAAATVERLAGSAEDAGAAIVDSLSRPTTNEFVPVGYAGLAGDAWTGLGLGVLQAQVTGATAALEAGIARPIRREIRVLGGGKISAGAVTAARDTGATHVLLDAGAVSVEDLRFTLARPFAIEGVTGIAGLRSDPGLAEDLANSSGSVQTAQLFAADLSMIYFDAPDTARGTVLLAPLDWDPPRELVTEIFARVGTAPHLAFSGLSAITTVEPVTADGATVALPLTDPDATPSSARATGYDLVDTAAANLTLLDSLVVDGGEDLPTWHNTLLESPDTDLVGTSTQDAYAGAVVADTSDALAAIEVEPIEDVRLTAREADLPVTIRNGSGMTLRLVINLESPTVRFPEGSSHEIDVPPRIVTEEFPVEVSGPGPHVVTMRVLSPDGAQVFAQSRIRVRSTAVNSVALILTIGSLAFLALWWIVHNVRDKEKGRRGRHIGSAQEVWARHESEEARRVGPSRRGQGGDPDGRDATTEAPSAAREADVTAAPGRVGVPGGR
ncbi:MAG: hypothetical protein IT198_14035 [Acidimicrobiia bacterium]|nr:hypothetical protein [Acidimicrobiia bacterium]